MLSLDDIFRFNDKCRLKHLPTQQYLAVQPIGNTHTVSTTLHYCRTVIGRVVLQLTLKQLTAGLRNDPEVTFSLISATKGVSSTNYMGISLIILLQVTGYIQKGSYVELRHIGTGKNLTSY